MRRFILIVVALLCVMTFTAHANNGQSLYEKGYQGYLDFSIGVHNPNNGIQVSLLTSHGYSTGFGQYTGLGTGLEWTPDYAGSYLSMPLFLDLKYSFLNSDFSPYVGMRTGLNLSFENMRGGAYLAPSVGVDIKRHLSLFLEYDYQTTSYDILRFKKHAFSVGVAIGF